MTYAELQRRIWRLKYEGAFYRYIKPETLLLKLMYDFCTPEEWRPS